MWTRAILKFHAKENLSRNYWRTALVSLLLTICVGGGVGVSFGYRRSGNIREAYNNISNGLSGDFSMPSFSDIFGFSGIARDVFFGFMALLFTVIFIVIVAGIALRIFFFQPMEIGCRRFFLDNHNEPAKLSSLGFPFYEGHYGNLVKTQFLKELFLFLWSLLFVIPGIVKSYSYRFVPYILADDPELSPNEVITLSRQLMNGNKWKAFVLDLSFILWGLLNLCTCGILGLFWLNPYIYGTNTEFYLAERYNIADHKAGADRGKDTSDAPTETEKSDAPESSEEKETIIDTEATEISNDNDKGEQQTP